MIGALITGALPLFFDLAERAIKGVQKGPDRKSTVIGMARELIARSRASEGDATPPSDEEIGAEIERLFPQWKAGLLATSPGPRAERFLIIRCSSFQEFTLP